MKKKVLLFPLLLLLLTLACSNNDKAYDLASITQLFETAELHLKPQAEDDYPAIMNVAPTAYELVDDMLYIYVFETEHALVKATENFQVEEHFNLTPYEYRLKNVLVLYFSQSPSEASFVKQIGEILKEQAAKQP